MARTAFGRPLRSVAFDAAISACVALFALAAVRAQPGSWRLTLIGVAMAAAVLFRRTHPSTCGAVVAALALLQTPGTQRAHGGPAPCIARELHDVVAHSLAVMIVQADGATYMLDQDPDTARGAIKIVADTGREALEEMRRLVGVLRDATPTCPPAWS